MLTKITVIPEFNKVGLGITSPVGVKFSNGELFPLFLGYTHSPNRVVDPTFYAPKDVVRPRYVPFGSVNIIAVSMGEPFLKFGA
jgi:hypothetical protein